MFDKFYVCFLVGLFASWIILFVFGFSYYVACLFWLIGWGVGCLLSVYFVGYWWLC